MHFSELEAFEAVVHRGSFTGAAKALSVTTGAVTRRVQALEARLGARLFHRSTRRVTLTDTGRRYHEAVAPALADILAAGERVRDEVSETPRGKLRVSLPVNLGRLYVTPHLGAFLRRWPDISLDLQLEDRFVDVIAEGFDLAVRVGALTDSRLVARKLANTRRVLVASPAYLEARGAPRHPSELVAHDCLPFTLFREGATWELRRGRERLRVPVSGVLESNYGVPLVDAAVGGLGILQSATFAVADELARGLLVEVLPEWSLADIGVFVVFPGRGYRPRKVDVFIELLERVIGKPAAWERLRVSEE